MLVGKQNNPSLWNISFLPSTQSPTVIIVGKPTTPSTVTPSGPQQWSANFGNLTIQEFAVQVSTTNDFKGTRAHW